MPYEFRHGQADVEMDILEVLSHGKTMTTQEITKSVRSKISLAPADLRKANKRDERKIDQIIANALQDKRRLCQKDLIERVERGLFRITAAGQGKLHARAEDMKDALADLADLGPN